MLLIRLVRNPRDRPGTHRLDELLARGFEPIAALRAQNRTAQPIAAQTTDDQPYDRIRYQPTLDGLDSDSEHAHGHFPPRRFGLSS